MKRIGISFAMAVGLFAGATIVDHGDAIAQSSTTGSVRGRIVDKKTKDAVIGATVSVSGPALQGQQSEITDENGALPPAPLRGLRPPARGVPRLRRRAALRRRPRHRGRHPG